MPTLTQWCQKWGALTLDGVRDGPWRCGKKINHVGPALIYCTYISMCLYMYTYM
jgi:hypothetical protein